MFANSLKYCLGEFINWERKGNFKSSKKAITEVKHTK